MQLDTDYAAVFVNQGDEWHTAVVVPSQDIVDEEMPSATADDEVVVRYFETLEYEVVTKDKLQVFDTQCEPFLSEKKLQRNYCQVREIRLALDLLKFQKVPKYFKWSTWKLAPLINYNQFSQMIINSNGQEMEEQLYELYQEVKQKGGFEAVEAENCWESLSCPDARQTYLNHLTDVDKKARQTRRLPRASVAISEDLDSLQQLAKAQDQEDGKRTTKRRRTAAAVVANTELPPRKYGRKKKVVLYDSDATENHLSDWEKDFEDSQFKERFCDELEAPEVTIHKEQELEMFLYGLGSLPESTDVDVNHLVEVSESQLKALSQRYSELTTAMNNVKRETVDLKRSMKKIQQTGVMSLNLTEFADIGGSAGRLYSPLKNQRQSAVQGLSADEYDPFQVKRRLNGSRPSSYLKV